MPSRLTAIDRMRGLAMVLMTTDHASSAFDAGHTARDSALFRGWDAALEPVQFLFRWVSHLCAPTFVFLAGVSLALSVERRRERGESPGRIDRDLAIRGLSIIAVDLLFIHWFWEPDVLLLQVMYAIGASLLLMVGLRRLPSAALLAVAALVFLAGEWLRPGSFVTPPGDVFAASRAALLTAGVIPPGDGLPLLVVYPVLPWCAVMVLGWCFGRWSLRGGAADPRTVRRLAALGAAGLALFVALRAANGLGNLGLVRADGTLLRWLHVSKYPPSLSFLGLELGLAALLLAAFFAREAHGAGASSGRGPLLVFGQTALFFYLAHIAVLELSARALGRYHSAGMGTAVAASVATLALLYPVCLGYRRLKARHPHSVLRYL